MKFKEYLNEKLQNNKFVQIMLRSGAIHSTEENLRKYNKFDKKDPKTKGVYDGDKKFWVILEETKLKNEYMVKYLSPYIAWDEDENDWLIGWTDGHNLWDNYYKSIHLDDTLVVMFLP